MSPRVSLGKMGLTRPSTMNLGPTTISLLSKVQVGEFENEELDELLLYSAGYSAKEWKSSPRCVSYYIVESHLATLNNS